jgi:putative glycosyltransferase
MAYVFLIDVDLEEHPESLTAFWDYLSTHVAANVVICELQTEKRGGGLMRRLASSWVNDLFNFLSYISPNRC